MSQTEEATADAESVANDAHAMSDEERALRAQGIVKDYMIATMAASTVPAPLLDMAVISGIQMRMIAKLSELYGRKFTDEVARNVLTSLAGGILGYGAGAMVFSSMLKTVPGIGTLIGFASLSAITGAATYAVGKVLIKHFEEGGSLGDLSVDEVKAYGREQFEKGKRVAKDAAGSLRRRGKAEAAPEPASAATA